jgi:hypothetical protein
VFLQLENITASAATLSLKNPWKWQLREQKALAGGGYTGLRLRGCGIHL